MIQSFFLCKNCGKEVNVAAIGTKNRNHCPYCLWSLHVDKKTPGDRYDTCRGMMEPVGLIFKDEGIDKYGKKRQGEIMLVHRCVKCDKTSTNRIAGDDDPKKIIALLNERSSIKYCNIEFLNEKDKEEVKRQLFGK